MKRYAVIGCGRFGFNLACTLNNLGKEVLVIDIDGDKIRNISGEIADTVQGDATSRSTLHRVGISEFDVVIVGISSNFQASIMATLIAKDLGVKTVIAKACDILHGEVLYKVGADRVIYPERDMGIRVGYNLASSNILDFIELSSDYCISEVRALEQWTDKTLKELMLPSKYGINVMAIKRGNDINVSPYADDIVFKNDILVLIGNILDIKKLNEVLVNKDDKDNQCFQSYHKDD